MANIEVKFTNLNLLQGKLEKVALEKTKEKLRRMRCPKHGRTPEVISEGSSNMKIKFCCDDFGQYVLNKLKQ